MNRIPELEALCSDARIRSAIESGDPFKVYRAFPMGTFSWLQSRVTALVAIGSILVAGTGAVHRSRYHEVRVFNAFAKPLQVSIGSLSGTVPAHSDAVFDVPVGVQPARAVAGEVVADETQLDVRTGADVLAWNVAGATPVFSYDIRYAASADTAKQPEPTVYCGRRLIRVDKVDFAFREPDKEVSVPKGAGYAMRSAVTSVVTHPDAAFNCAHWLSVRGRDKDALPAMAVAARLSDWDRATTEAAFGVANGVSADEAVRFARMARDAHPERIEVHRPRRRAASGRGPLPASPARRARRPAARS